MGLGLLKGAVAGGALALLAAGPVQAAPAEAPKAAAAPTKAGDTLAFLNGIWVGTAKGTTPSGEPYEIIQTERVGPMQGGDLTVIEGRGFVPGMAEPVFNAFAIVSYNPQTQAWEFRSYSSGYAGTFAFEPRPNGFVWYRPNGRDSRIRYTATITGDRWEQVGEELKGDAPPRKMFEMSLRRTGSTDWPMAGAPVPPAR